MNEMNALELNRFSVCYDGRTEAVRDLSLQIQQGEIVSIVGESGSGKSTLVHAILGLLSASAAISGEIRLLGRSYGPGSERQRQSLCGRELAIIFQNAGRYMNPVARIGTQYREMMRAQPDMPRDAYPALAREMLKSVHLRDVDRILRAYPFELSGGMCQRVAIAMALTCRPKILFADEPTSALDVTVQEQVVAQLIELRERFGMTILMVTHNIGVAAYMSDHIGVMQRGHLVEWNTAEEIVEHPREDYTRQLLAAVPDLGGETLAGSSDTP